MQLQTGKPTIGSKRQRRRERQNWRDATIADAVDHTIQNTLRHELTVYDHLLLVGVRRKDARRRVQPKINAMVASWKSDTPADDADRSS